jgi:hypothetical protein
VNVLADVPALHGSLDRLEPLSMSHGEDLAAAVEEDRGAYGFTHVPRGREVATFLAAHFARVKAGKLAPFALIRLSDGRAVGCTAYWDPRFRPGSCKLCAIETGWTWLSASPSERALM